MEVLESVYRFTLGSIAGGKHIMYSGFFLPIGTGTGTHDTHSIGKNRVKSNKWEFSANVLVNDL